MTMHVFIHLANHACNDQQPLLEIFFPEEATTIIGFIFSIIPPQVNELAMGKCMPENLGCWVGRSKRGQGKETVDGSGEHSVMIQGLEKTDNIPLWGCYFLLQHQMPLVFAGQRLSLE